MTASIVVLVLLALVVALLVQSHRSGRRRFGLHQFRAAAPFAGVLPADRDSERLVAELRAMPGSRADLPVRIR
jgi:hypothetical protein